VREFVHVIELEMLSPLSGAVRREPV
jgi:hypothetical protein